MTDLLKKPLRPFAIVPTALICDPRIKLTAIKVYAVLASHKKTDNTAWCTLERLRTALSITSPNVCKALRELQQAGYITKIKKGGGPRNKTEYTIRPPDRLVSGDNQGVVSRDNQINLEDAIEAKNFAGSIVSGDNRQLSHETPKYTGGYNPSPLPPPAEGEMVGPDGPAPGLSGSPDGDHMDGPDGPAPLAETASETGRPNPDRPKGLKKKMSSGGARVEDFTDNLADEAKSKGYARQKLIEYFKAANGAYKILIAAEDTDHPEHVEAVEACERAAKKLAIFWSPPKKRRSA